MSADGQLLKISQLALLIVGLFGLKAQANPYASDHVPDFCSALKSWVESSNETVSITLYRTSEPNNADKLVLSSLSFLTKCRDGFCPDAESSKIEAFKVSAYHLAHQSWISDYATRSAQCLTHKHVIDIELTDPLLPPFEFEAAVEDKLVRIDWFRGEGEFEGRTKIIVKALK